jgi:hypothetical protein
VRWRVTAQCGNSLAGIWVVALEIHWKFTAIRSIFVEMKYTRWINLTLAVWKKGNATGCALLPRPEEAPGHVRENATMCGIVASAHYAARSKGSFFGFAGMAQSAPPYLRRRECGWSS